MKTLIFMIVLASVTIAPCANAAENSYDLALFDLENFQRNSSTMLSSGLPTQEHFEALKAMGVSKVIDLLPSDRTEEILLMKALKLSYYNIPVEWENPTLENFELYIQAMQGYSQSGGKILTHCQLNWRGAVFTYLYRVTQLKEAENVARQDLDAIWEPNEVWQRFIEQVKAKY